MSLVGNLEDLGLGEILQIVSLSRKTGILSITSDGRAGSVSFRQGQVVRAFSTVTQQSLGEVLIQRGDLDVAILRNALSYQQEHDFTERLGVILIKIFGVSSDLIEEVVREQIENIVFSLFTWTQGNFTFEVLDTIETVDGIRLDPLQFMLDQGLNPQFLAMEGTRILDEERNSLKTGSATDNLSEDDADFAFDLLDSSAPAYVTSPVAAVSQQLVIVDDDIATLQAISDGLTGKGFVVHTLNRSEDALILVDSLHRGGEQPTVLIDLIMPKMDGSGQSGGIELLKILHNNFQQLHIAVMSDSDDADAEKLVHEMGHDFILKPGGVEMKNHDIVQIFLSTLLHDILGERI